MRLDSLVKLRQVAIVATMFRLSKYQRYWLDFLLAMTAKEIKARYKFAALGFLWIVLNPLLQMLIVGSIFRFLISVPTDNYFMYLFAGLLPWNFFSYTVSKNTPMILNERSLIKKAYFPRENIILSVVAANAFHLCIAFLLFFFIAVAVRGTTVFVALPSMIFALVLLCMLTAGCSLLFSTLNVRFRDVNFFVQALMPLWFYATPIVYATSMVPSSLQYLLYFNPLTLPLELLQFGFAGGESPYGIWQLPGIIITSAIFVVGWWKFTKDAPFFEDWV